MLENEARFPRAFEFGDDEAEFEDLKAAYVAYFQQIRQEGVSPASSSLILAVGAMWHGGSVRYTEIWEPTVPPLAVEFQTLDFAVPDGVDTLGANTIHLVLDHNDKTRVGSGGRLFQVYGVLPGL